MAVKAILPTPYRQALRSYQRNFGLDNVLPATSASGTSATIAYLSANKDHQVLLAGYVALVNQGFILAGDDSSKAKDPYKAVLLLSDAAAQLMQKRGRTGVAELQRAIEVHLKTSGGILTATDAWSIRQKLLVQPKMLLAVDRWEIAAQSDSPFVSSTALHVGKLRQALKDRNFAQKGRPLQPHVQTRRSDQQPTPGLKELLVNVRSVLKVDPTGVNRQEYAELIKLMPEIIAAAEEEDSLDFWAIILAILTLGLSLLHDYLTDAEHEQVLELAKKVEAHISLLKIDPDLSKSRVMNRQTVSRRMNPGPPFLDLIPGTKEKWAANRVAELLYEWVDGGGTKNEKRILDLLHGLNIRDREEVAEAFCRLMGTPKQGREAFMVMSKRIKADLKDHVLGLKFWETKDGAMIDAILDPDNLTGDLTIAQEILFDLGVLGPRLELSGFKPNSRAVIRRLSALSTVQLKMLDAQIREFDPAHRSLKEVLISELRGDDEKRAIHAATARRLQPTGGLTSLEWKLYGIMDAIDGLGTKDPRYFRMVESMTGDELRAMAAIYYDSRAEWGDENRGGSRGPSGPFEETAFYKRMRAEFTHDSSIMMGRFELAMKGLARPNANEKPEVFQARLADYIALVIEAGKETDIRAMLRRIKGPKDPDMTRVTVDQVFSSYASVDNGYFPGKNLFTTLSTRTSGELRTLANIVMNQEVDIDSAEVAAHFIAVDMATGFGKAGVSMEVLLKYLNRPHLSPEARQVYLKTVQAEVLRLTGKDLKKHVLAEFGATMTPPGGKPIATLAMSLMNDAMVTPAERFVAEMVKGPDSARLRAIMADMGGDPASRFFTMHAYATLVGRPIQPGSRDNPLIDDLFKRGKGLLAGAMVLNQADAKWVALTLEVAKNGASNAIRKIVESEVGNFEVFVNRFLPDDASRAGVQLQGKQSLERGLKHGSIQAALRLMVSNKELAKMAAGNANGVKSNTLRKLMMDCLGTDGHAIDNQLRRVAKAARDAETHRDSHGNVPEKYAKALAEAYKNLSLRVQEYDQLATGRVRNLANITLSLALAATLLLNPGVSTSALMAVGGATNWSVHALAGDAKVWHFVTGAIDGYSVGFSATKFAMLPANATVGMQIFHGAFTAAQTGMLRRGMKKGFNPRTYDPGKWRGFKSALHSTTEGVVSDIMWGGISGYLTAKMRQRRAKRRAESGNQPREDITSTPDETPHPGGGGAQNPTDVNTPGGGHPGGNPTQNPPDVNNPGGGHPGGDPAPGRVGGTNPSTGTPGNQPPPSDDPLKIESPVGLPAGNPVNAGSVPPTNPLRIDSSATLPARTAASSNSTLRARNVFARVLGQTPGASTAVVASNSTGPATAPPVDFSDPIQTYKDLKAVTRGPSWTGDPDLTGKLLKNTHDLAIGIGANICTYMTESPDALKYMAETLAEARKRNLPDLPAELPKDFTKCIELMIHISMQMEKKVLSEMAVGAKTSLLAA